jgi:hypothetical protein
MQESLLKVRQDLESAFDKLALVIPEHSRTNSGEAFSEIVNLIEILSGHVNNLKTLNPGVNSRKDTEFLFLYINSILAKVSDELACILFSYYCKQKSD